MKIEAGKRYIDSNNHVTGPMCEGVCLFIDPANSRLYHANGRHHDPDAETWEPTALDLAGEWDGGQPIGPLPAVVSDPMYGSLAGVLQAAHDHAARGKGHDRHGDDDKPFLEQPTMQITRMVGLGYPAGQIMKKADEAKRMVRRGEFDAAVFEFFGIINYAAAAVLAIREVETFREVD